MMNLQNNITIITHETDGSEKLNPQFTKHAREVFKALKEQHNLEESVKIVLGVQSKRGNRNAYFHPLGMTNKDKQYVGLYNKCYKSFQSRYQLEYVGNGHTLSRNDEKIGDYLEGDNYYLGVAGLSKEHNMEFLYNTVKGTDLFFWNHLHVENAVKLAYPHLVEKTGNLS